MSAIYCTAETKKKGGGLADTDTTPADEEATTFYFEFC